MVEAIAGGMKQPQDDEEEEKVPHAIDETVAQSFAKTLSEIVGIKMDMA